MNTTGNIRIVKFIDFLAGLAVFVAALTITTADVIVVAISLTAVCL